MANKTLLLVISFALVLMTIGAVKAECDIDYKSQTTDEFFSKITTIDTELKSCQPEVPKGVNFLYKNAKIEVNIEGKYFTITIKDAKITEIKEGQDADKDYTAEISNSDFTSIISSDNLGDDFMSIYKAGKIKITANGFFNTIRLWISQLVLFFVPAPAEPVLKAVGEECNDGEDCKTGNCIGVVPGQLYQCSCDPFTYVAADTSGNCPVDSTTTESQQRETGLGIGEICQDGGECETGNCIYVYGQGAERTHKCSCDPFTYDELSCV